VRAVFLHAAAALGFAALAIVWSWPLALHLSTHLPGTGIGDNALFLWNFWWMRMARASGAGFWHTEYLLAPIGADLVLHTHTALPAWIGATLLRRYSLAAALNLTTLGSLALNGFCAYLLAWRIVRQHGAAILAGVVFATSPYVAAHLSGHFNLITAWTIPLFALCFVDAARGSIAWAVLAGAVLAVTGYIDYYYVIYEVAFACCVAVLDARQWSVTWRARPPYGWWLRALIGVAMAIDVVVLARLGLRFNPLQGLWVLIAIFLWLHFRPRVAASPREGWSFRRTARSLVAMLGVFLIGAAPILWNGALLLVRGLYVTQRYGWRSAPAGIDVATMFMGNPFHPAWGAAVRHLYARLGIDLVESGAWLGIVPLALAAYAIVRRREDPIVRHWAVLGGVFFVWALGPHVHVAGQNTGMIMPEVLLRFVPIASNARMPGRAMVVVYLAVAMLAASGAAHLRWRRPAVAVSGLVALVLAEFFVAPFPLVPIECPAIYRVVKDRPESGALVELPLGLGDGFGDVTPTDRGMLVCQTMHERPLVGGALARLPANVLPSYVADPLIATWLRLSGASAGVVPGESLTDATIIRQWMDADGVAFVMLNRRTASAELRTYVEQMLPLTPIARDDDRTLYLFKN
jgi:hypothetical protein